MLSLANFLIVINVEKAYFIFFPKIPFRGKHLILLSSVIIAETVIQYCFQSIRFLM